MDKYQKIIIKGKQYYSTKDIKDFSPEFFYGCNNKLRRIIEKKNIPNKDIVYGYYKNNELIICGDTYPKATLYLSEKWVNKFVPEATPETKIKATMKKLPPLITGVKLPKNKKNMKYSLTIRGDIFSGNIYFKLNDIAKIFKLKKILTIISQSKYYVKELHYEIFYSPDTIDKKSIYITLLGFERIITNSRCIHVNNAMVFRLWLSQFQNNNIMEKSIFFDDEKTMISMIGYVYCVMSDLIDAIKIGFWTGNFRDLVSRYKTYYGKSVQIITFYTIFPSLLEKKTHDYFRNNMISNELFDKNMYDKYVDFISKNCIKPTKKDIEKNSDKLSINIQNHSYQNEKYDNQINNVSQLIEKDIINDLKKENNCLIKNNNDLKKKIKLLKREIIQMEKRTKNKRKKSSSCGGSKSSRSRNIVH